MTFPVVDGLRPNIVSDEGKSLADLEHAQRHDETYDGLREVRTNIDRVDRNIGQASSQVLTMAMSDFMEAAEGIGSTEGLDGYTYETWLADDVRSYGKNTQEQRALDPDAGFAYGPLYGTEAVVTLAGTVLPSEASRVMLLAHDDLDTGDEVDPIWGYGGTGEAVNAASPLLVSPEDLYGYERSLRLPGTAGSYASAPDVNLLPAYVAHIESASLGGHGTTSTFVTDSAWFGEKSLRVTTSLTTNDAHSTIGFAKPGNLVGGETVAFSIYAKTDTLSGVTCTNLLGGSGNIGIQEEGGSYRWVATAATVAVGPVWTRIDIAGTVPTTPYANWRLVMRPGRTTDGEELPVYYDAACLRIGTNYGFIPSTRITGDIDIRAHVALDDWSAGATQYIAGKGYGHSYYLYVAADGKIGLAFTAVGGSNYFYASSSVSIPDKGAKWIRAARAVSTGATTFYVSDDGIDWTTLNVAAPPGGAAGTYMNVSTQYIAIGMALGSGIPAYGNVSYAEIRDGIDGPVVAAFNAGDFEEDGTTATDRVGNTWTVHGNAVVRKSRVAWLPGANGNYMGAQSPNLMHRFVALPSQDAITFNRVNGYYGSPITYQQAPTAPTGKIYSIDTSQGVSGFSRGALFQNSTIVLPKNTVVRCGMWFKAPVNTQWHLSGRSMNIDTQAGHNEGMGVQAITANGSWQFIQTDSWTLANKFIPGVQIRSASINPTSVIEIAGAIITYADVWPFRFIPSTSYMPTDTIRLQGRIQPQAFASGNPQAIDTLVTNGKVYSLYLSSSGTSLSFAKSENGSPGNYRAASHTLTARQPAYARADYDPTTNTVVMETSIDGVVWTNVATALVDGSFTLPTIWGYGGSSDTTTPNAASPMLMNLRKWGVSKAGWLPGVAGNYFSTPDVNVLNANQSSFEQGTGGWIAGTGSSAASRITTDSYLGSACWRVTTGGTHDTSWSRSEGVGVQTQAASPGSVWAASARMKASPGRYLRVVLDWISSGGAFISRTVTNPLVVADGSWQEVTVTGIAPANTAYVVMQGHMVNQSGGTNLPAGEYWYLDAACLRTGSTATFIPSTRITGDIDLRARVALKDWTPGTTQVPISKWTSTGDQRSWILRIRIDGKVDVQYSPDGVTSTVTLSTATISVADRDTLWLRATVDVDNGSGGHNVRFYTSSDGVTWTQLGDTVTVAGTTGIFASSAPVTISGYTNGGGELLQGAALYAEVRDGINGPVVAKFDPQEHSAGDTWTSSTGETWTVNRSGDATAEIVDRQAVALSGTEYLRLPDQDSLDVGMEFTYAARVTSRSTVRSSLMAKRSSNLGWDLAVENNRPGPFLGDGSAFRYTNPADLVLDVGEWNTVAGQNDASKIVAVLNGTTSTASNSTPISEPFSNAASTHIGNWATTYFRGQIQWVLLVKRVLTPAEHTELAAWNGSVATEPSWLRAAATFYWNADDEYAAAAYETNNDVVNLAGMYAVQVGALGGAWPFKGVITDAGAYDSAGNELAVLHVNDWNSDDYTDDVGRTWQVDRQGDVGTEVVSADSLMFTGAEHAVLPSRSELDFNLVAEDFEFLAGIQSRIKSTGFLATIAANAEQTNRQWQVLANAIQHVDARVGANSVTSGYGNLANYSVIRLAVDGGSSRMYLDGTTNGSVVQATAVPSSLDTIIGARRSSGNTGVAFPFYGTISWIALLRKSLTASEAAEVNGWDGSVQTEPHWLRGTATFYWNAADPQAREAYVQNNEVRNLAVRDIAVVYEASLDGGATWESVEGTSITSLTHTGTELKLRARFVRPANSHATARVYSMIGYGGI